MTQTTDRIEKQIILRAPRERVWSAIIDSRQFGTWFGMKLDRPFAPGATVVVKHFWRTEIPPVDRLAVTRQRRFGETMLTYLELEDA